MKSRFGIKLGDVIIISAILLTAVLMFFLLFFSSESKNAQIAILQTGETREIPLSLDATYEITSRGFHISVTVEDGEVFVSQSDCRDGICKNTLPISRAGQSIVCAPAGVIVKITGEGATVDGVSG